MPNANFLSGATTPQYTATNSDWSTQTSPITTPQARLASNGNRPIKITQVRMHVAGFSASRTVRIEMTGGYNGSTGNFTVASGSSSANTGFKSINVGMTTTPASSTVSLYTSGRIYIGNNDGSGSLLNSTGGVLASNRKMWGEYSYVQVPATPSTPSISADRASSSVSVSWSGISDWGDSSSGLGYRVDLYRNGSFYTSQDTSSTSTTFSSLPTSSNYYARVSAYNEIVSFSGSPMSFPSNASSTVTLEPPIINYTVSFNSNGGSNNPSSQTVQSGNTIILPSPGTRTGFSFDGWISNYNFQYYGAGSTSHAILANTTFTASWTQLTWTVSFNGNGGSTPSSQTVNQGSPITLPSSTRSGFTFNGWWTSSSGGSFIGNANSSYTPSNNITLFAQWQALAPGFTDEIITARLAINVNVNTLPDNRVVATNADAYSLVSGGGTFPTWLSINNSGFLSGSTNVVGTYSFRVRATNTTSGQSVDSNIITITAYYPGKRASDAITFTNIASARRYDGSGWVNLTIMKRWNGSSWVDITN